MFQDSVVALLMLALVAPYTYAQLDDIISNQTVLTVNRTEEITLVLPPPSGNLEIYALPVGQGDCTIIQCPNGNLVVNDCGSSGGNRVTPQQIQAFLGNRIGDVVAIFITHPDRDHFNYLYSIPWTTSVQKVIIGATLQDYNRQSSQFAMIYNWLVNFNNAGELFTVSGGASCIGTCTVPVGLDFCNNLNINFNILAANVGTTSNQKSIVMKITSGTFTVLSSGDMEGPASTTIAGTLQGQLSSVVYKMSHHGASRIANSPTWLMPIAPRVAFASSGYNFGNCRHPRCDTINRLRNLNTLVAAAPHTIYCGNSGPPTQLPGFTQHIYETSPTSNMICFLNYTSTFLFNQACYNVTVLEPSVGLGDDECPVELEGGAPVMAAHYTTITVVAFLLALIN